MNICQDLKFVLPRAFESLNPALLILLGIKENVNSYLLTVTLIN